MRENTDHDNSEYGNFSRSVNIIRKDSSILSFSSIIDDLSNCFPSSMVLQYNISEMVRRVVLKELLLLGE